MWQSFLELFGLAKEQVIPKLRQYKHYKIWHFCTVQVTFIDDAVLTYDNVLLYFKYRDPRGYSVDPKYGVKSRNGYLHIDCYDVDVVVELLERDGDMELLKEVYDSDVTQPETAKISDSQIKVVNITEIQETTFGYIEYVSQY